jgi:protein gp37
MGDDTKIQWTESTWNPVRGCSRVSEGCRNCYAEGVAARFSAPGLAYAGLARQSDHGPRWTGKVVMVPEHLDDPIRWKRPRRIFVNSMSDLFHEGLTDEQIASVFRTMLAAPRHTYQVLTKRAARMRAFVRSFLEGTGRAVLAPFIWLGVSVEDQERADERVPELLATAASVRFVSAEPLLGPVDFDAIQIPGERDGLRFSALTRQHDDRYGSSDSVLDWIIVGGESGRNARPFDVRWARDIVGQCSAAGAACFVKQLGARPYEDAGDTKVWLELGDGHGGNIAEWPSWVPRVREFPEVATTPA